MRFQSRPDGEWAKCKACDSAGYGPDSWHPVTVDFWQIQNGKLLMGKCKACRSEATAGKFGFVPEGMAA